MDTIQGGGMKENVFRAVIRGDETKVLIDEKGLNSTGHHKRDGMSKVIAGKSRRGFTEQITEEYSTKRGFCQESVKRLRKTENVL